MSRGKKCIAVGEMFLLVSMSFAFAFLMSGAANHFTNPLFRKDVS